LIGALIGIAIVVIPAFLMRDHLLGQQNSTAELAASNPNGTDLQDEGTKANPHIVKSEPPKLAGRSPRPVETVPTGTIQPFGDIAWDDNLVVVIEKILALDNLETIEVIWDNKRITSLVDMTEKRTRPEYTQEQLGSLLRSRIKPHRYPVPGIDKEIMAPVPTIIARPIVIGDGIYTLKVNYTREPGSILSDPEKALKQAKEIFGEGADFYYPIYLRSVSLDFSESKTALASDTDRIRAIHEDLARRLADAYASFPLEQHAEPENGSISVWTDKAGHGVSLSSYREWSPNKSPFRLSYHNRPVDFLSRLYDHQQNLARKAQQEKFVHLKSSQVEL
jgi:hypothetical protein